MTAKTARALRLLLSHTIVVALASCATFVWISLEPKTLPPLLQGVTASLDGRSPSFNERLADRFPVGSMASGLIKELGQNDFQVTFVESPWHGAAYDNFNKPGFDICRKEAFVRWQEDGGGRLTAITGRFVVTCL